MKVNDLYFFRKDALEGLEVVRPFVRAGIAFLLQMRYPLVDVSQCYQVADQFLLRLKEDIAEGGPRG
jgi:hypothetical protein